MLYVMCSLDSLMPYVMSVTQENAFDIHNVGRAPYATTVGGKHIHPIKNVFLYHYIKRIFFSFIISLN
jgi:hypothetical protein